MPRCAAVRGSATSVRAHPASSSHAGRTPEFPCGLPGRGVKTCVAHPKRILLRHEPRALRFSRSHPIAARGTPDCRRQRIKSRAQIRRHVARLRASRGHRAATTPRPRAAHHWGSRGRGRIATDHARRRQRRGQRVAARYERGPLRGVRSACERVRATAPRLTEPLTLSWLPGASDPPPPAARAGAQHQRRRVGARAAHRRCADAPTVDATPRRRQQVSATSSHLTPRPPTQPGT